MGCGCGSGTGRGGQSNTIGFYVTFPDGSLMPQGIEPENPDMGAPPYLTYHEAQAEVLLSGGGTVRRLKRAKRR